MTETKKESTVMTVKELCEILEIGKPAAYVNLTTQGGYLVSLYQSRSTEIKEKYHGCVKQRPSKSPV